MHFADSLMEQCRRKQSRLVVGLDPHWNLIPAGFKAQLGDREPAEIVADYLSRVIEVTADSAAAFKPQSAFFEQFGVAGMRVLRRLLDELHERDELVILDGKRNDIGSTAAAYARTYFGDDLLPAAFPADALTVNAYLGEDGINPFTVSEAHGVFVLVKTSNPSSGTFQDLTLSDGTTLANHMASAVNGWNESTIGSSGYGNVGAVVGATYPEHMRELRQLMPRSLLLVPGYGAQGGSEQAIRAAADSEGWGALINSSRGICFAGQGEAEPFAVIQTAAETARSHLNSLMT